MINAIPKPLRKAWEWVAPGQAPPPHELSRQLRRETDTYLAQRRRATGLSLVAAGSMALITLYQMGIIDHLPEPPLPHFDADQVDAAEQAYARFATPDAALGLSSYTTTLMLIAMGGRDRAATQPAIPLALAAKATFDAIQAGKLTWNQWAKQRAFCFWCLLAAGATFAVLPNVFPEARAAWRAVRHKR